MFSNGKAISLSPFLFLVTLGKNVSIIAFCRLLLKPLDPFFLLNKSRCLNIWRGLSNFLWMLNNSLRFLLILTSLNKKQVLIKVLHSNKWQKCNFETTLLLERSGGWSGRKRNDTKNHYTVAYSCGKWVAGVRENTFSFV